METTTTTTTTMTTRKRKRKTKRKRKNLRRLISCSMLELERSWLNLNRNRNRNGPIRFVELRGVGLSQSRIVSTRLVSRQSSVGSDRPQDPQDSKGSEPSRRERGKDKQTQASSTTTTKKRATQLNLDRQEKKWRQQLAQMIGWRMENGKMASRWSHSHWTAQRVSPGHSH